MVMYARKAIRVGDGCNDRRDSQSYQTHKSQPKSQSSSLHRYDKTRDGSSDPTPPYKVLRRSDESPVSRHGDNTAHNKAKLSHAVRGKNGTSGSPQENSHNSFHHSSESHVTQNKPTERDPADDWTEHISSSGKKYYYNCRTEVSQWEKPKDLLEREQRQKDKAVANSFPRDMDYRQEALQDKATSKPSGDQSTPSNSGHSSSGQSVNAATAALSSSSSSSLSAVQLAQSQALLQDPALLHQLLLQMNNGGMDRAKLNEISAQHSGQSPVSLTSEASSPQTYVSPRNGTPQSSQKSAMGPPAGTLTATQSRGTLSSGKPGSAMSQLGDKRPEDPRTFQQRSQDVQGSGSNVSTAASPHIPSGQSQADAPSTYTPTLATHFDENLIKHIQGWPSENTEKQASRLREDMYNMGSLYMSELCTEMKNLRSLVRVCEIQATLREQRVLFLRQQSKELEKLKNQNSFMV
ncbi:WW domain-containing adapter protein with coiled-coil-like isoform X2 [Boleophthalmus pectinirostris]|uniref:WW domain-containing adapter protein with coiled-coil-like isoform X2 n=1 Tax=Boleophthalmus pectinirostris TaxID=150288 RepID=UPI000A1C2D0B|nr:WW domain-containing adapter protein with coiled-coil-like isoform X2 [Boleophthalmus pectinirostris]